MSDTSWPRVLDMSEDSARKALRSLEISAYSSLVATFRAQGDLTPEKRSLLQQLRQLLGVTTERHRAELRRCVNDEKFTTIAYHMVGPNHDNEWLIEGRRLAPLAQRLALHTAFTSTSNQAVTAQVEKNSMLPQPSQTGNREQFTASGTLLSPPPVNPAALSPSLSSPNYLSSTAPVTKYSRAQSPNTNVVILPSGTSIHIKGNVGTEDDEDITGTKRRRLASTDTTLATTKQIVGRGQPPPLKLTLSNKTSSCVTSTSQKVILVQSSSGQTVTTASTACVKKTAANSTVPIVKSITPIISHTRTSVVYPASTSSDSVSTSGWPTIHTQQGLTIQKPRAKATLTTTPRMTSGIKSSITVSRHGVVIPASTNSISSPRTGVHVKQEGAMKIITSSNNKLLPRSSTANSTPIVVVTSSSGANVGMSSASPSPNKHTVITRPGTGAVAINNNKVISIHTGSKLINASAGQKAVGLKAIGQKLTSPIIKSSSSPVSSHTITTSTGKSGNVVIVQQAGQTATIKSASGGVMGNKEFVSFIQKHGSSGEKSSTGTSIPTTIKALPTSPVAVNIKSSDFFPRTSFISGGNRSHSQVIVTPISSSDKPKILQSSLTTSATCSGKTTPTWLQSTGDVFTTASTIAVSTNTVNSSASALSPTSPPKIDIFSSALAEADINLDPYEFIDEDEPVVASTVTTPTSSIEEPPIWSSNRGDNTSGVYQLSQGAAILSGELPFLPTSTSISTNVVSSSYALPLSKENSVIDTATTLIAQASNMLAQTTREHTPTACISNSITAAPLAPQGTQAILPKGKELIRILPVTPSGSSLLTNSSASVTRPHLTIKSRPSTQTNPKHVDIQPRVSSISSPPFIDTKILILPPGIGQPNTPVKEPSAELVDSLVQTPTDSAISTSLLNFAQVAASLQQEQTSAEVAVAPPEHESLTIAADVELSAVQSLIVEASSDFESPDSLSENNSTHQPFLAATECNALPPGKEMKSILSNSTTAESIHEESNKICNINNIQSDTELFRQNLLKASKLEPKDFLAKGKSSKLLTPRSNILPWEIETNKNIASAESTIPEATQLKDDAAVNAQTTAHLATIPSSNSIECSTEDLSQSTASQSAAIDSKADPAKISIETEICTVTADLTHTDLSSNSVGVLISDHVSHTPIINVDAKELATCSNSKSSDSLQTQSCHMTTTSMKTIHTLLEEVSTKILPVSVEVSQSSAIFSFPQSSHAEELMQLSLSPHSKPCLEMPAISPEPGFLTNSASVDPNSELSVHETASEQPCVISTLFTSNRTIESNSESRTLDTSLNQLHNKSQILASSCQEEEVGNLSEMLTTATDSSAGHITSSSTMSSPECSAESVSEVKSASCNVDGVYQEISQHMDISDDKTQKLDHSACQQHNNHARVESPSIATNIESDGTGSNSSCETVSRENELQSNKHITHSEYENSSKNDECADKLSENSNSSATTENKDIKSSQLETCIIKDQCQTSPGCSDLSESGTNKTLTVAYCVSDDQETVALAGLGSIHENPMHEPDSMISASQDIDRCNTERCSSSELSNSPKHTDAPFTRLSEVKEPTSLSKEKETSPAKTAIIDAKDQTSVAVSADITTSVASPTMTDTSKDIALVSNVFDDIAAVTVISKNLDEGTNVSHELLAVPQAKSNNAEIEDKNVTQPTSLVSSPSHSSLDNATISEDGKAVGENPHEFFTYSTVDTKSDDSLSDSSPPLIARRNFERVYRPRSSRSLSAMLSVDSESTSSSASVINSGVSNQSKSNGSEETVLITTDCSTVNLSSSASQEGKLEITNTSFEISSPILNGSKCSQEKEDAEDWLADSGHSFSNGPTSQGEESDEDESTNEAVLINQGTEKVVRRGRKRRRRSDQSPSWSKAALGLLKRVMIFRGSNRNKGEHGAAAWFLKPVSDDEAPGYSDVITQPMDFGTIKRKLETNSYPNLESFRSDMVLIHSNCCKYNPPEHNVRRDCELVFVFFHQEFNKLLTRLQQASSKKPKVESGIVLPT